MPFCMHKFSGAWLINLFAQSKRAPYKHIYVLQLTSSTAATGPLLATCPLYAAPMHRQIKAMFDAVYTHSVSKFLVDLAIIVNFLNNRTGDKLTLLVVYIYFIGQCKIT